MTDQDLLVLRDGDNVGVLTADRPGIARGHKVALVDIEPGTQIRKYGQSIGVASVRIGAGSHVHTHNVRMDDAERVSELGGVHHEQAAPAGERPTFLGYRRANGRVGTRNYIGIVTSVNCSASTARMIAAQFPPSVLDAYENIDGVMALTHTSGCGLVLESEGAQTLERTLRGYAEHPNFAGILVLGLGCEMLQVSSFVNTLQLSEDTVLDHLTIQESGGVRASVRAGVEAITKMLDRANDVEREACDVSELVLGLNCGGSDGYSGITANPALGWASDLLVSYGGRSVLAETPEVFGAEHLLTRRAVNSEVAQQLLDRIDWWRKYAEAGGGTLDNNPSPGNKAGGLTTILEKSLGAVAKAGQSDLSAVYRYAERIDTPGLGFMDTPGYDPVSVTGLIAGGATVVCFTTGRGSVLGGKPSPSIKLATNTQLYERQREDIDIDCGRIIDGTATLAEVGQEIFDRILQVASGAQSVSEELDLGQDEFVPWQLGTVT
jgi:altronate hydrolase